MTYVDTSVGDNNTSEHAGSGMALIVDAHPQPIYKLDGLPWRERVQIYDAPFSQTKAHSFTLHVNGAPSYIRGQNAQPVFDDTRRPANCAFRLLVKSELRPQATTGRSTGRNAAPADWAAGSPNGTKLASGQSGSNVDRRCRWPITASAPSDLP